MRPLPRLGIRGFSSILSHGCYGLLSLSFRVVNELIKSFISTLALMIRVIQVCTPLVD